MRRGKRGKRTAQEIPKTVRSPVVNLSEVPLSSPQTLLLSKGLSFAVTNKMNAFNLKVDTQLHETTSFETFFPLPFIEVCYIPLNDQHNLRRLKQSHKHPPPSLQSQHFILQSA